MIKIKDIPIKSFSSVLSESSESIDDSFSKKIKKIVDNSPSSKYNKSFKNEEIDNSIISIIPQYSDDKDEEEKDIIEILKYLDISGKANDKLYFDDLNYINTDYTSKRVKNKIKICKKSAKDKAFLSKKRKNK